MEESLVARLLATSGLTALTSTRLYWGVAPQNVGKPYVVLYRISGVRDVRMSGPTGLTQSRIQIDCYGSTYASAKGVARQVEASLSGFRGTQGATIFDGCFLIDERDLYDADGTIDDLHRVSLDFNIWHKGV